MDNCGGQSYDGAGNMAGRYAGALTLIQHQFANDLEPTTHDSGPTTHDLGPMTHDPRPTDTPGVAA